jgi:uncharacterized membrane protein SpoIIM required for sporulation/ABC-type transport system involved in multi-copper enzyme maturation permease subunit
MGEMVTSPQGLQQAVEQVKVASTPPLGLWPKGWRAQLFPVWVITRRDIHDTMRDWRLMVPIVLLTLVFPVLLNFIARFIMDYFGQYTASIIGKQAIPFLLLVAGFFPISFSLVVALETFVGEKERRSLEPLLATPLSNTQLYLGKTLAALIPPVLASYLGIAVYLGSLFLTINYRPPLVLVLQTILLTTAEALIMVSIAVIVSSQTTSVRAANLLAGFIILSMALLVQGEAIIMFWANYATLWFVLMALIVCDLILVRMGVRIFNREELLGREIDSISLRQSWRSFKGYLLDPPVADLTPVDASGAGGLKSHLARFYRHDMYQLLRLNRAPLIVVLLGLMGAVFIGWQYAVRHPLPVEVFKLEGISRETFEQFQGAGLLPTFSTWEILSNNVRSLLAAGLLAVLSFGSIAIVLLMAPIAIVGFLGVQMTMAGYNPLVFTAAFILPHGIFELPAAIIATATALRLGASVISPPPGMTVSQSWLQALAHFIKLFVLVVLPLLIVAALIEVHITPQIVIAVYGN